VLRRNKVVQDLFSQMAKRWMTQVVRKARSLNNLWMNSKYIAIFWLRLYCVFCQAASDLRHLKCVSQTRVEDVSLTGPGDLRDPRQSPECRTVKDAISIALKFVTLIFRCGRMSSDSAAVTRDNHPPRAAAPGSLTIRFMSGPTLTTPFSSIERSAR
jgi:hypothetical protein